MSGKAATPTAPGKAPPPAPARANPTTHQPPRPGGHPTENDIRTRAFSLWEQAGCPQCDGVEFWLRAEQELKHPR
jgi:hypothetical protein